MKKILLLILVLLLLVGCGRKLEEKTIEEVELKIKNTYHRESRSYPMSTGKFIYYTRRPEKNIVYFDCDGYEISIDNKDVYNYCKDKETINAKVYKFVYSKEGCDREIVEYEFKELIDWVDLKL